MKTFIKSVFHANIGLACLHRPVLKNEIVEVPETVAEKLLKRTVWNEDLGKDVNVWEKSTAAEYKAQKAPVAEETEAPAAPVPQQEQNVNETSEHLNDAPDTADTTKGRQAAPPTATRLSSEGENDAPPAPAPEAPAGDTTESAPATAPAKAAKKPAAPKPAKPAAAATPAAPKRPQRKAPTK